MENTDTKAARLLTQGCVQVLACMPEHVTARVRGDHGIHDVNLSGGVWSCSCPALGWCSHLAAVYLVSVPRRDLGGGESGSRSMDAGDRPLSTSPSPILKHALTREYPG